MAGQALAGSCHSHGVSIALVIFILSYLVIAGLKVPFLKLDRPAGAMLGGVAMVVFGVVSPAEAMRDAVNHDTLLLLLGMMIVSAYMAEAEVFRFASWFTLTHVRSPRRLLAAIVFVSGLLSGVLVNDTICLMFTPLVVQLVRDARLRPLPFLLALAFGANAGSVATLTGNPQNMIIGTLSGVSYARFAGALFLPALASLVVVAGLLLLLFRRDLRARSSDGSHLQRPALKPGLAVLCLATLVGVVAAFFAGAPLSWTAMSGASVLMLFGRVPPRRILGEVDGTLLLFFGGLFIITYGVASAGVADAMFTGLRPLFGDTTTAQAARFGAFTVFASQVVSNVPFVLLAAQWMPSFIDPPFMWLSMALFSTLAGNLTIVGSVANIIVLEGAREDGRIRFMEFLRYGAIVTASTVAIAYAVLCAEHGAGW